MGGILLRVLHLVFGLEMGGLERFVLDLVRHHEGEVSAYIACMNYGGALVSQVPNDVVYPLYQQAGNSLVKKVWHLRRYCAQQRIDLIHTHNVGPHLVGALAGISLGIPVIHTKHGRNNPDSKKERWFSRIASLATQYTVGVSQDAAVLCCKDNLRGSGKVKVILNGVDTTRFRPPVGGRHNMGPVRIGIVARVAQVKNHANLLRAFKLLLDRQLFVELTVVGDGPLLAETVEEARNLEIDGAIRFLGARMDIPALLHQMDIFVLPSFSEGISLTLLEAMACELPVVATDVGGNREVVLDGDTGYVVPSDDSDALAEALARLVGSQQLRERMGSAGRQRVVECFSMERTARQYLDLYRPILKR